MFRWPPARTPPANRPGIRIWTPPDFPEARNAICNTGITSSGARRRCIPPLNPAKIRLFNTLLLSLDALTGLIAGDAPTATFRVISGHCGMGTLEACIVLFTRVRSFYVRKRRIGRSNPRRPLFEAALEASAGNAIRLAPEPSHQGDLRVQLRRSDT